MSNAVSLSTSLAGREVRHDLFGCGVITSVTDNILTVSFKVGEKRFIYPDAFKEHLTLSDIQIGRMIKAGLDEKQLRLDREREAIQAEIELRRKLRNYAIDENSHAAFDIAPHCAKETRRTCTVSTGRYISGYSKGEPRIVSRLKPNSVCLLTELPSGEQERAREITGAFMVQPEFFGEDCITGIIEGHSEYRMFPGAERKLLLWHYSDKAAPARWGNIAFKYCSALTVNRILFEMLQMSEHSELYAANLKFYLHFCKINQLQPLKAAQREI